MPDCIRITLDCIAIMADSIGIRRDCVGIKLDCVGIRCDFKAGERAVVAVNADFRWFKAFSRVRARVGGKFCCCVP